MLPWQHRQPASAQPSSGRVSPVAAGLRQGLAGIEHARPVDEPAGHRHGQPVIRAAGIAHGGEAALERALEDAPCVQVDERLGHGVEGDPVDGRCQRVEVGVDQARHETAAAELDDARALRLDRPVRDLLDPLAFNQDLQAIARLGARSVEDQAAAEQGQGH